MLLGLQSYPHVHCWRSWCSSPLCPKVPKTRNNQLQAKMDKLGGKHMSGICSRCNSTHAQIHHHVQKWMTIFWQSLHWQKPDSHQQNPNKAIEYSCCAPTHNKLLQINTWCLPDAKNITWKWAMLKPTRLKADQILVNQFLIKQKLI